MRSAYPGVPVFRVEPNTAVEVARGVLAFAAPEVQADGDLYAQVKELFGRLGKVVEVPERLMSVAGGLSGVGPGVLGAAGGGAGGRRGAARDARRRSRST